MVALNFPSSPSVNQLYTEGPLTYIFNGIKWKTFSNDYTYNGLVLSNIDNVTTVDISLCNFFTITLTDDTTIQFTNPPPSGFAQKFFIRIIVTDEVSTITWPASVIWADGVVPTITALGETDLFEITTSDNGTSYHIRQRENEIQSDSELPSWDISKTTYSETQFVVTSQDTNPTGIRFSPDGTKMFVIGSENNKVYQYNLSIPWNILSATYSNISLDVSTQDTNPVGLEFSTDGTLLYVVGAETNTIYRYGLLTSWSLTGAVHDTNKVEISIDNQIKTVRFSSDGGIMFVLGVQDNKIYQYLLPIKWDISSSIYLSIRLDFSNENTNMRDFTFKPDGTRILMLGGNLNNDLFNNTIYEYNLTTEWNLFTASYSNVSTDFSSQINDPTGFILNDNGTNMYIINNTDNRIYKYILTT